MVGTNYNFLTENVSLPLGPSSVVKKQIFLLVDTLFLLPNISMYLLPPFSIVAGICFIDWLLIKWDLI